MSCPGSTQMLSGEGSSADERDAGPAEAVLRQFEGSPEVPLPAIGAPGEEESSAG
jgi:hypothetical protein